MITTLKFVRKLEPWNLGIKRLRHDMSTTHEEADVIIPQQVITAIEEGATCVKVISDDTCVCFINAFLY